MEGSEESAEESADEEGERLGGRGVQVGLGVGLLFQMCFPCGGGGLFDGVFTFEMSVVSLWTWMARGIYGVFCRKKVSGLFTVCFFCVTRLVCWICYFYGFLRFYY